MRHFISLFAQPLDLTQLSPGAAFSSRDFVSSPAPAAEPLLPASSSLPAPSALPAPVASYRSRFISQYTYSFRQ